MAQPLDGWFLAPRLKDLGLLFSLMEFACQAPASSRLAGHVPDRSSVVFPPSFRIARSSPPRRKTPRGLAAGWEPGNPCRGRS